MRAMDLEHTCLPGRIGGYRLLRRIGRGGMGEVWLARKPGLVKPCALKIVLPEHARNPEYRQRFLDEARILSTLRHGCIVTVIEVGEADGYLFIAMDYIDGVNLRTLCEALVAQGRRLPVIVSSYVIGEVFEALRHAHTRTIGGVSHGVIHRDVTPDNVMISSEGEVFLSDFGIACFGADGSAEMCGKLQYMAPEQGMGSASYRSDIWSACGVLHYMLTGEPPRHALTVTEFMENMHPLVRPTGRRDVPEPLERLRASGLEPDAGRRLASAKDALLLLESWLGYRKTTTMLAEIYADVIGPARSGITDLMPMAVVQPRAPAPPCTAARDQPLETAAATIVVGRADHALRFVEPDAPRLFRRKRLVAIPEDAAAEASRSSLEVTGEAHPTGTGEDAACPEPSSPVERGSPKRCVVVGFVVAVVGLAVGLAATCETVGALGQAARPAAEVGAFDECSG